MQGVDDNYSEDSPYWKLRHMFIGDCSALRLTGSRFKLLDVVEGRAALVGYEDIEDGNAFEELIQYRIWLTGNPPEGTFRLDDMFIKKMYIVGKSKHKSNDWINRDESVREVFEQVATERIRNSLDTNF